MYIYIYYMVYDMTCVRVCLCVCAYFYTHTHRPKLTERTRGLLQGSSFGPEDLRHHPVAAGHAGRCSDDQRKSQHELCQCWQVPLCPGCWHTGLDYLVQLSVHDPLGVDE